jgi:hypothetical protein
MKQTNIRQVYTALSDGTHIHHRVWGNQYCTQQHKKPLPFYAKATILLLSVTVVTLLTHIILKSNNL